MNSSHLHRLMRLTCSQLLLVTLVSVSLALMDTSTIANGQERTLISRDLNFDGDLSTWNIKKAQATVVQRNWVPNFRVDGTEQHLGTALAVSEGPEGCFGQTFKVPAGSTLNYLTCHAYMETTEEGKFPYASVSVTYYDSNWNELSRSSERIDRRDTRKNRGNYDGMNLYTNGIAVPEGAENVFLFVYVGSNTRVYFDGLALYDYKNFDQSPAASNIVANPRFQTNSIGLPGKNTEFWFNNVHPRALNRRFNGQFGFSENPEFAYQFIPLQRHITYTLSVSGANLGNSNGSVGVDFFDENWERVGKQVITMNQAGLFRDFGRRLILPPNAVHASLFVYKDRLLVPNGELSIYEIMIQESDDSLNFDTSAIIQRTSIIFGSKGTNPRRLVTVIYNDADGLDRDSIDSNDVYFESVSDPNTTYPAQANVGVFSDHGNRIVFASYVADAPNQHLDVGRLVIKANQVKDTKGNFFAGKGFDPF